MSEIKGYHSSFTGQEVDALLTKVKDGSITADIEKELAEKANKSGYYPQMSVGQADNLPDRGDVTEGFIGFRESAGAGNSIEDGTANVVELLGESLVWNQLWDINGDNRTDNIADMTIDEREVVLTIQSIGTYSRIRTAYTIGVVGHKYYVTYQAKYNSKSDDSSLIAYVGMSSSYSNQLPLTNSYQTYSDIWVGDYAGPMNVGVIGTRNDGDIVSFKDIKVIDLTKMFQAGNEPTTVEEFNAIKNQLVGVDFNAYNEGEVLGVNIKGIKSVNDNAWDEKWESGHIGYNTGVETPDSGRLRTKDYIRVLPNEEYHLSWPTSSNPSDLVVICYDANKAFIQHIGGGSANKTFRIPTNCHYIRFTWDGTTYNHDICIRLAHSGYKTDYVAHEESESSFDLTKYFPNGMHGLNGVRDSATPKKATRRFGVVDLSSLTWNYYSSSNTSLFKANFGQIKVESAKVANIICGRYVTVDDQSWQPDKVILATPLSNGMVWIHDEEYKDNLQGFIESLGDLKLIYELATPIETEIDPQLNMNYKVWDFGTEELLTDSKSAPVLARTIYGFNATDTIRGNKAMNENQEARIHTLESEVVRKGDYSPDNSVGFADDLVGRGESVPAEFSFRASGGKSIKDGAARIKRLRGNSVVWNQKSPKQYVNQDDVLYNIDYIPQNHKFALIRRKAFGGCYYFPSVDVYDYVLTDGEYAKIFVQSNVADAEYSRIYSTAESGYVQLIDLTQMFGAGNEPTTIEEFYARKPIVEDEYAYNEGQVIHCNTESIKSVGDNAWDEEWIAGRLNTNTGQPNLGNNGITSKNYIRVLPNETYYCGYNAAPIFAMFYDAEYNLIRQVSGSNHFINIRNQQFTTPANAVYMRFYVVDITTYNHDIMISLVHSGWKQDTDAGYQPYWEDRLIFDQRIKDEFPDGMKKWDMVYNKDGKGYIVKGAYKVKIKDLNIKRDAEGVFIAQSIPALANVDSNGYSKKILSARFIADGSAFSYDLSPFNIVFIVEDNIWMNGQKLASYLTVEDFIHDYGDEVLYYELAEPTIIEYDEPFNLDYKVADFGTEQAIAEQPSAPISADIIYQFNAVDMIREHELEIAELQSIIATMQAQLASLTNKE